MAVGRLRGIKWKSVDVMLLSMGKLPRVLVQWELEPTTQNLSNLKFFVDRSESPSQFSCISSEPILANVPHKFVDYTPNLRDMQKVYYYRIRAVEYAGDTPIQSFISKPTTWDGDLDRVGLYIVEEQEFYHRRVTGVPSFIFKKIRDGVYCPLCWDRVLKKVTRSNCKSCYGTGKIQGYYPGIETWITIEPDARQDQLTERGVFQESKTTFAMTNYPVLSQSDLVYEVIPGQWWRVSAVSYPEKGRTLLIQNAQVDALKPTDIEQELSDRIPMARRLALLDEVKKRDRRREY
jgi:hypothetical protein